MFTHSPFLNWRICFFNECIDFTCSSFLFSAALRVQAYFKDAVGERANTELLMLSHYSPFNKHLRVSTSTVQAKVIYHFSHPTQLISQKFSV